MRITVKKLERLHACRSQITMFKRHFPLRYYPNGVTVTEERCIRLAQKVLWSWAANHLLNGGRAHKFYRDAANKANEVRFSSYALDRREMYNVALAKAFYAATKLVTQRAGR